jgi:hypothetical protein
VYRLSHCFRSLGLNIIVKVPNIISLTMSTTFNVVQSKWRSERSGNKQGRLFGKENTCLRFYRWAFHPTLRLNCSDCFHCKWLCGWLIMRQTLRADADVVQDLPRSLNDVRLSLNRIFVRKGQYISAIIHTERTFSKCH